MAVSKSLFCTSIKLNNAFVFHDPEPPIINISVG